MKLGQCGFPTASPRPQPWSRRDAAVTSVEHSGSAIPPAAVFLRDGARKEFLAGAPRPHSPWRSGVPVLRRSERRGEGRPRLATAQQQHEAEHSFVRPSPPWLPLKGNADVSYAPSICSSLTKTPLRRKDTMYREAPCPLRVYKNRPVYTVLLLLVPHAETVGTGWGMGWA